MKFRVDYNRDKEGIFTIEFLNDELLFSIDLSENEARKFDFELSTAIEDFLRIKNK